MNEPDISAIICTYNRSNILEGAIESLIDQTIDKNKFEIIIIDNNSSDNTHEVVKKFEKYSNVRYVFESEQGLAFARNRGYIEAKGRYIAYIDDDAKAESDWIENIYAIIQCNNPPPLIIGGPIYPFYLTKKPEWYLDEYEIRTWGKEPRYLNIGEYLSGSNMIFSKEILEEFGGFDTKLGVVGGKLNLGEESSLFNKIWEKYGNTKIGFYSPDLKVYHLVPDEKMTLHYFFKRRFMAGQSNLHIKYRPLNVIKKIFICVGYGGLIAYKSFIAILKLPFYRKYQNWIVECLDPVIFGTGIIFECLGFHMSFEQYDLSDVKHDQS